MGHILIRGNAAQRIIGSMFFNRRGFANAKALRHFRHNLGAKARAIHHTGRHAIHIDIVGAGFQREAFGDAAQAPFGCGIGHAPRAATHAESAPHIHDLAALLRDHGGQTGAHGVEATAHIQMHDFIEFLFGGFPAGLPNRPRTAGDIHQNINPPAEACAGFLHRGFAGST